jgi:hypothetical protein
MNPPACPSPARRGCAFAFLICTTLTLLAQDSANPPETNFNRFRIIAERNIFNPNRSGRATPPVTRTASRPAQVDSFTLVGTLGDGKHWIAFFNGTRSELRGRLQLADTIGDYTVTGISNSGVQLEQDTNTIQLRVGMTLRRENEGPWLLAERSESTPDRDAAPRPEPSFRSGDNAASTGQIDNEVLRRLMQQRERELQ